MPRVPGLRSPHAKVGRLVLLGRTLDKIRLAACGELPPDYGESLGDGRPNHFDARLCRFLGVAFADLRSRTLAGGCDEEIAAWAHARGTPRTDEECVIWNRFITKLGWRDDRTEAVRQRTREYQLTVQPETLCELFDADEGRPLGATRCWEEAPVWAIVVMGVSGCGKTTVGRDAAARLGWEFLEGDSLHSPANIAKMSAGTPLTDADRAPWLAAIAAAMAAAAARGARLVVGCSALKHAYRVALAPDPGPVRFAYLKGDGELLRRRLRERTGHFMKETLLQSQLETLEEPLAALTLDAGAPAAELAERIQRTFAAA